MRPNRQAVSISTQQLEREIRESLQQMLWDRFAAMINAPEEIRILSERLVKNGKSPYPFIQAMGSNLIMELVNQRAKHENGGQEKMGR